MRSAASVRHAAAVLGAAWVLFGASRARAGEADARARSDALFREGVTAGKAGDYARAEIAFRTSYRLLARPSTLRNWALTEMKRGEMLEALGHLQMALRWAGWTSEQRAIVQQNFDDAYAATGHVAIETTEGAEIAIDGVPAQGVAPLAGPVDVQAGRRQIEARLGSESARAEVDARPGEVIRVRLPIAPVASQEPAPAPGPAMFSAPPPRASSAPGVLAVHEEPPRNATWWTATHATAVGLAAAAVVGAGVGLSFDAAAHAAASDADTLRGSLTGQCAGAAAFPSCATLRDAIGAVHRDETLEAVGFALGAAAGVGAAIAWALAGPSARVQTGRVRWTPTVAARSVGVAGAF